MFGFFISCHSIKYLISNQKEKKKEKKEKVAHSNLRLLSYLIIVLQVKSGKEKQKKKLSTGKQHLIV